MQDYTEAYHAALAQLAQTPAVDTLHLHDRHPLSPEVITQADALDLMRRAVAKQGGEWRLLYIGYYILSTLVDAACFWPNAAVIAVSHCEGCGDVLCEPMQAVCAACQEYERAQVAADVGEWVGLGHVA